MDTPSLEYLESLREYVLGYLGLGLSTHQLRSFMEVQTLCNSQQILTLDRLLKEFRETRGNHGELIRKKWDRLL
jgi:hypothetical protein